MVFRMYGRGENVFTKIKPTFSRKIAVKEYRKNGVGFVMVSFLVFNSNRVIDGYMILNESDFQILPGELINLRCAQQ